MCVFVFLCVCVCVCFLGFVVVLLCFGTVAKVLKAFSQNSDFFCVVVWLFL